MGTPEFAVPALDSLVNNQHKVLCVYTQPPSVSGRGKKVKFSAVHNKANELGLLVRTPTNLNNSTDIDEFSKLKPEIIVVVAYGQILSEGILKIPELGCLNIHASLLPRWRGAAPIHRAIISGDKITGVCIMRMELGLDTGPIMAKEKTPILQSDTTTDLSQRLAFIGSDMLVKVLIDVKNISAVQQSENGITYAKKINKEEARIDWSLSSKKIEYLIRGLSNAPGAWTMHKGVRLKLLNAELVDRNGLTGNIIDHTGVVSCGSGSIRIISIQRPGKAAQNWSAFTRGYKINPGDNFI
jgi:methionyl-tRNA formyltransferase